MRPHLRPLLLLALFAACTPEPAPPPEKLPLDVFVQHKDDAFKYEVKWSHKTALGTSYMLAMTSQRWRTAEEVGFTEWTHHVGLHLPDTGPTDTALIIIAGADVDDPLPDPESGDVKSIEQVAMLAGTPVAMVLQIPAQPLEIKGQGGPRVEDELVAASWDRVLATQDPTWSAYFPMARAVVRAMDAVQDHARGLGRPIERFVATGYSKRGATTYLATAADPRIVAMAPGVFDFLNFRPQAKHHLDVYGTPAPAVRDYAEFHLLDRIADPQAQVLLETSDPYAYRARFTMPKLVLASAGDQFFLPDAMRYYLDDLPGETLLRFVPNSDHSLSGPDGDPMPAVNSVIGWYHAFLRDEPRPRITWSLAGDTLSVATDPPASAARLWKATNAAARDFRRDTFGPNFVAETLAPVSPGRYGATVPPPAAGFTCFFVEVTVGGTTYTTRAWVTPDA